MIWLAHALILAFPTGRFSAGAHPVFRKVERMAPSTLRFTFCVAVAVLAAAIADPVVEFASNAGWFGTGNFTDHSNLDVLPAVLVGLLFAAFQVIQKAQGLLSNSKVQPHENMLRASDRALGNDTFRLLPLAFVLQILVLYLMETAEQILVSGHTLGGTIWLGGPVLISIALHALACVLVAFAVARSVRALAKATIHVIRVIRALASLSAQSSLPIVRRRRSVVNLNQFGPVLCSGGERAPPLLRA